MHVFWESVIQPLLMILQPKNIVEIGVEAGKNSMNILEHCLKSGAVLHAIDPKPRFDVDDLKVRFGDHFFFYPSLSLEVLPDIQEMDLVLIDGDHNWYTVYHELKLIEEISRQNDKSFPMVAIHDISWPYGRRDLYYNPDKIPSDFLKPYLKKGVRPGSPELAETGGFNSHLNHAVFESDARNGVLTAVEDFMKESDFDLELVTLPAYYGLGLLFPSGLRDIPACAQWIDSISTAQPLVKLLEQIEKTRVTLTAEKAELDLLQRSLPIEADPQVEQRMIKAEHAYRQLEQKMIESEHAYRQLEQKIALQGQDVARLTSWMRQTNNCYRGAADSSHLSDKKRRILFDRFMSDMLSDFRKWDKNAEAAPSEDISTLQSMLETLEQMFSNLLRDPRWKIGSALVLPLQLKKKKPLVFTDDLELIFCKYHGWKPASQDENADIQQLNTWVVELEKTFQSIIHSRRWKAGDKLVYVLKSILFIRDKNALPRSVISIRRSFATFYQWRQSSAQNHDNNCEDKTIKVPAKLDKNEQINQTSNYVQQMFKILDELEQIFWRLLGNPRWKIGSFFACFKIWGKKPLLYIDRIQQIFLKLKSWRQCPGYTSSEIHELQSYIVELEHNFQILFDSKRWKIGDKVMSTINKISLKSKSQLPKSVQDAQQVFISYRQLINTVKRLETTVSLENTVKAQIYHNLKGFQVPKQYTKNKYEILSRKAPCIANEYKGKKILVLPVFPISQKRNTTRYRVENLYEQLDALGYKTVVLDYKIDEKEIFKLLKEESIPVVLQRFSYHKDTKHFLKKLRRHALVIIYDIDDPLFCKNSMDRIRGSVSRDDIDSYQLAMKLADCFTVSTRSLRDLVKREFGKPVYIIQNCLSQIVLQASLKAQSEKSYEHQSFNIGYISGSNTHDDDFEVVISALVRLLEANPLVRLILAGYVSVDERLTRFESRITRLQYVPYTELPKILAQFDLQIIPLENCPFNESKSHIRFLESAAVKCPVVASAVGEQANTIIDGVTGFLVDDEADWFNVLSHVIHNPKLRKYVAEESFEFVKTYFHTFDPLLLYRINQLAVDALTNNYSEKISVMIVTYNKPYDVREAIKAVCEHTSKAFELFVWDNTATAEMREVISELTRTNMRVIFSEYNVGKSVACNYFFNNFVYDYVCGLDDDYYLPANWAEKAIRAANAVPNLGWLSSNLTENSSGIRGLGRLDTFNGIEIYCPPGVGGWMVFTKEESRQKIGLYQEHGLYGGIDGDYKQRARSLGLYAGYIKDIVGEHKVQRGMHLKYELFKQRIQDQMRIFGKSNDHVSEKFIDFFTQSNQNLSVAIKICTSTNHDENVWGDTHYARGLACALKAHGYNVIIDKHENWYNNKRGDIDVVIHLFGLHKYKPDPYHINLLWIISHPELIDDLFLQNFDIIFSASKPLTDSIKSKFPQHIVEFLPQCTDDSIFFPDKETAKEYPATFVGNSRRVYRNAIKYAVENSRDVKIWGTKWEMFIDTKYIVSQSLPSTEVANIYRRSNIVLNDHWEDQKIAHIINNRIFDVLACNVMVLSDENPGIADIFGDMLPTFSNEQEFLRLYDEWLLDSKKRDDLALTLGSLVRSEHTFLKRAQIIKSAIEQVILNYVQYKSERKNLGR